jgi:hypothetical protein
MPNDLTDAVYWASKDPEVAAVHTLPFEQREAAAQALDTQGFTLDRQIDIWGWSPSLVMQTWVGLGLTHVSAAAFNDSPSVKFIKVSLNSADYPPFAPGPPPLPPVKPVGAWNGSVYAANITACVRSDGSLIYQNGVAYPNVNGDGKTYVFHATLFWGIWSLNWTLA